MEVTTTVSRLITVPVTSPKWVEPFFRLLAAFDFDVRAQLAFNLLPDEEMEIAFKALRLLVEDERKTHDKIMSLLESVKSAR